MKGSYSDKDYSYDEELHMWTCLNCGAYIIGQRRRDSIKHYPTCQPGEAVKWGKYYAESDEDEEE